MWKLSIEDDQGNKTVVKLVRDEYTLGRAEDNAIRLTERNISRRHATVKKNGSGWLLADRNSYNGCFVNGGRVSEHARLEHGDLIQVGDYRLTLIDERLQPSTSEGSIPAIKSEVLLGQPDRLVMLVGPTPGAEYALATERMLIGRGEECDIAINHSSVSRVHAEVHALGQGRYEVMDLGSSNGVRINGIELERSLLHPRDVIELGDVILKFIPAGEIYKPTTEESQQIGALGAAFAAQTMPAPRAVPTSAKIIAAVVGLGLLMVLGVIIFGRKSEPALAEPVASGEPDHAVKALTEAKALLDRGDVEGAHEKALREVPEGSNARQLPEFRLIEARWADMMLERAEGESDPAKRKVLLDQVARTASVDSTRRKRAHSSLEQIAAAGQAELDITDLPKVNQPPPSAAPSVVAAARPVPAAAKPAPAEEPRPERTSKPAAPAANSDGLIRDNPFDDPRPSEPRTGELATSGDRRQQTAAKNALKTKVANGTATEQEARLLRALCRQLGDASCAD